MHGSRRTSNPRRSNHTPIQLTEVAGTGVLKCMTPHTTHGPRAAILLSSLRGRRSERDSLFSARAGMDASRDWARVGICKRWECVASQAGGNGWTSCGVVGHSSAHGSSRVLISRSPAEPSREQRDLRPHFHQISTSPQVWRPRSPQRPPISTERSRKPNIVTE